MLSGFAALAVSWFLTPYVKNLALSIGAVDKPDGRKIHKGTIPLMGGIAIFIGFAAGISFFYFLDYLRGGSASTPDIFSERYLYILIGGVIILFLGIYDDLRGADAKLKFVVQFAVASFLVYKGLKIDRLTNPFGGDPIALGWMGVPLTVFWIVGVTNAVNLSDGMDGLASGISMIVAITLSAIAIISNKPVVLLLSLSLAGSLMGFLKYNFNPARIFMGDTGSLFLGYILALISLKEAVVSAATVSLIIPFVALGVPIFDTLFAMVRRIITGASPFSADKDHFHHRLLSFGFNQKQTVFILYFVTLVFGMLALMMTAAQDQTAAGILFLMTMLVFVGIKRLGYIETILVKLNAKRIEKNKEYYQAEYNITGKKYPFLIRRMTRHHIFEMFIDFVLVSVSYYFAMFIIDETCLQALSAPALIKRFTLNFGVCFISFLAFGYYKDMWRHISLGAIGKFFKGVTGGVLLSFFIFSYLSPENGLSMKTYIVYWLFMIILIIGVRISYNFFYLYASRELADKKEGEKTLIYGAGDRGELAANVFMRDSNDLKIVGFIDDDPLKQKKEIHNYKVLGSINDLDAVCSEYGIQRIVLSSKFVNGNREHNLKSICRKHNVSLCNFRIALENIPVERKNRF
ncbi:MAG: hypothetical protein ACLFQK_05840 [Fibrobacterota bacterium]